MQPEECNLRMQERNNEAIVALHPHKALLSQIKPRFMVIRKGWGRFKRIAESFD